MFIWIVVWANPLGSGGGGGSGGVTVPGDWGSPPFGGVA